MGKLKWDANHVYGALDRLEVIARQAQPKVDEIGEKAAKLRGAKNLPQYVTQRLDNFIYTNKATVDRLLAGIRSVRGALPEIERNHRHKLPQLRKGLLYRVMLGGAFLTKPDTEWRHYYRDESQNIYLGDILTYMGHYVLEGKRDGSKPEDVFAINGFIGAFKPTNENGRANLNYLAKVK